MTVLMLIMMVSVVVMVSAAYFDVRSREIPDVHWMLMVGLSIAMAFLEYDLGCAILVAAGYLSLSVYLFSERAVGTVGRITLVLGFALLIAAYLVSSEPSVIVTIVMSVSVLILYWMGVVRGGADAKALVCLSMLCPAYPEFGHILWEPVYPGAYYFNPVFSVIFMALLISLLATIWILVINLKERRLGFSSYHMDIRKARISFVWPLEDVRDGKKVRVRATDNTSAVLDRLEQAGENTVLVTPMIPFILPIAAAFILTIVLGCPLFVLL